MLEMYYNRFMENLNFKNNQNIEKDGQTRIDIFDEKEISNPYVEKHDINIKPKNVDISELETIGEENENYDDHFESIDEIEDKIHSEEADKIALIKKRKDDFIHQAGFLNQEDIDKVIVGDDYIARYLGMTIDEWKEYNKEDGWYK